VQENNKALCSVKSAAATPVFFAGDVGYGEHPFDILTAAVEGESSAHGV